MVNGNTYRGNGSSSVILFVSIVATVFVAERMWQLTHEIYTLKNALNAETRYQRQLRKALVEIGLQDFNDLENISKKYKLCPKSTLSEAAPKVEEFVFVDVQPQYWEKISSVNVDVKLDDPSVTTIGVKEDDTDMPPILGQVDLIEDGVISGWACEKGNPSKAHEIKFFVNNAFVGEVYASGTGAHSLVNRICAGPANIGSNEAGNVNVAFKFSLPSFKEGIYQLKAFVYSPDGVWRKELNSSPQKFIESSSKPGLSDTVKRKDAIIRARNAQVASLYEQLHSRGIWTRVTNFKPVISLKDEQETKDYLAFVGFFSKPTEKHSRDLQRKVWFPQGEALDALAEEKGIVMSDWMTENEMAAIREEIREHNDILMVDIRGFEDPAKKTLAFYKAVAYDYSVDFIMKADKDVVIDIDALVGYLTPKRAKGNLYMGCMKSGEVVKSARQKWHEPEHWKFGDGQGRERKTNYPRHAERQFLGVSHLVAKYLAQNAEAMHFYANDDVSVGVWLLGLEIEYLHERRFCCTALQCKAQLSSEKCVAFFDSGCSGLCQPDTRIQSTYNSCIKKNSGKKRIQVEEDDEDEAKS